MGQGTDFGMYMFIAFMIFMALAPLLYRGIGRK